MEFWAPIAVTILVAGLSGAAAWARSLHKLVTETKTKVDETAISTIEHNKQADEYKKTNDADKIVIWTAHHADVKDLIDVDRRVTRVEERLKMSHEAWSDRRGINDDKPA